MKSFDITFVKERETTNAVKFNEVPAPGRQTVVGALYVKKWAVGTAQEIKVTLEVNDGK